MHLCPFWITDLSFLEAGLEVWLGRSTQAVYSLSGFVTEPWSAPKGPAAEQHPHKCCGLCFCSPVETTTKALCQLPQGSPGGESLRGLIRVIRTGSIPPPQPGNKAARVAPAMGIGVSLLIPEFLWGADVWAALLGMEREADLFVSLAANVFAGHF